MTRIAVLIAALALLATACGGSEDDGVATLEDSTTTTDADAEDALVGDEARLMEFAACMRENGADEFPDPIVSGEGSVDFGGFGQFEDMDEEALEEAFDACVDFLTGLSFAPGGENFDLTGIEDTLLEFAVCMRDNGFDLPDPDFSNFDLGSADGGPFGEIDPDAPGFEDALDSCRDVFAGLPFGG